MYVLLRHTPWHAVTSTQMAPDSTDRKKQTHLRCERQRREAINVNIINPSHPGAYVCADCQFLTASFFEAIDR